MTIESSYRSISPISTREYLWFLGIAFGVTILTRIWVFPLSVVDWDESVYLIVSRDILHGVLPYQGAFDHKPVALYYIFSFFQLIFGENVYSIRILAVVFVSCTSFLISIIIRKMTLSGNLISIVAGITYSITSIINDGLSTNTEIIINLYFVAVMLLVNSGQVNVRVNLWHSLFIGGLLGFMFHTNYLSGVLVIGFCIIYLHNVLSSNFSTNGLMVYVLNGLIIFSGFLIVTVLLLLPIALWSDIGEYYGKQSGFLKSYAGHQSLSSILFLFASFQGYFHLFAFAGAQFIYILYGVIQNSLPTTNYQLPTTI